MILTADGTQDLTNNPTGVGMPAGSYSIRAQGAFGGGTLTVGFSLDGGTTVTPYDSSSVLTAPGGFELRIGHQEHPYIKLAGSTAANINVDILRIELT